ncbi:6210_t:CDS:2, partial [Dentiscutata heterogama]
MSGIESGEASQAENSFEVDDVLEEDPQIKEGEESVCDVIIKIDRKEKKCAKRFKYLSGWSTTNMNSHLADEHDIRVVPHKGVKKLNICRNIAEWLVINNRAFEVITGEGFHRFMLQVDSAFRRPSYKTLKKEIAIANVTAKNQINDLVAQSSETISLTTDLWTARNKTGYIGITAHWLSNKFELNEILLCLESMPATEYFSARQYPTIAYIHPVIETIKAHYAKNIDPDEYDYNNEVLQEIFNFDSESESSDDENESDISFDIQENQTENDTELI